MVSIDIPDGIVPTLAIYIVHVDIIYIVDGVNRHPWWHGPLARYVILWVAHAPGMPGTFSPPPRFSDPDMHHGTCVTHVPWCMSGSLTSSFLSRPRGKTFPAFPAHAQPAILRIWQEAHCPNLLVCHDCAHVNADKIMITGLMELQTKAAKLDMHVEMVI